MKKIDHVRKTVYIIVGILTIISLVFSLCKKVGLCASSSDSPIVWSGVPFLYGQGIANDGYFSDSFVLTCVDDAINRYGSSSVFIYAYVNGSTNDRTLWICFNNTNSPSTTNQSTSANWSTKFSTVYSYTLNGYQNTFSNQSIPIQPYRVFETINGASYYIRGTYQPNYPIYIKNYGLFTFSGTDTLVFSPVQIDNNGGAHSKGGVLGNYIDSHELLEDSSDLPEVDVTPPADPTTNNLLQKILNGLGVLNGSIQSGVLTIGDYIGQGFENVLNWLTEPFDSDQFNSDLNQIALINDFSNLKTQVENCGMFDWSDVTPAQSLSFTFDVGGAVLPHTSCVVDFSWYTGTVKNICVAVICTFLVLGLLVTIINQLPNIIGGKSGDKGGGSDS